MTWEFLREPSEAVTVAELVIWSHGQGVWEWWLLLGGTASGAIVSGLAGSGWAAMQRAGEEARELGATSPRAT